MSHPNSLDLEAFACGEPSAEVETHLESCDACRAFVGRLKTARPARPRVSKLRAAWVVVPLLAAALVLLVVRPGERPKPEPVASAATSDPSVTFKGTLPIAIIRDRAGAQARFVSAVAVKPDDRLRVEVALDHDDVILAGVLGDDGSWLELMPAVARQPGTYFSDRSARVDASPLRGTVLVGPPAQVALARSTHRFDGIATLRIEWEAP